MMKLKFSVLVLLTHICAAWAQQEMHPTTGVIASSTEVASINYSCMKPTVDKGSYRKIECEIHYETLKKLGGMKVQKSEVEAEFKKKGIPTELCTMFGNRNIVDMTLEQVQAEASKQDATRNSFNREMIAGMTPLLQKMCKEKSLDSFHKFVEFSASIEENTCEIETGTTKEIFTELPQRKGERSVWISEGTSLPPCGKKAVIKFVPNEIEGWIVQYENVVLNKQAKTEEGQMCKEVDGVRNVFNSRNSTWNFPCKYIKLANKGAWRGPFNPK